MNKGNLFTCIRSICERPGMYSPQFSVEHLFLFIQGYESALKDSGHPSQHARFEEWLYSRYPAWRSSSMWWGRHILDECEGDLDRALDEIIQLIEQFLAGDGAEFAATSGT
jgi:homogentisate 1,2-dioxygenase